MKKEFKFSLEMKFNSLRQFKEAILEYSVLNGRQIKLKKNDGDRVMYVHINVVLECMLLK